MFRKHLDRIKLIYHLSNAVLFLPHRTLTLIADHIQFVSLFIFVFLHNSIYLIITQKEHE